MLKKVLSKMLRQLADDVDNDKFDCGESEIVGIITQLAEFNTSHLSKAQACDYLNISRSTFDKMIKEGKIPKGKKRQGFKELSWTKEQLNIIKNEL